MSAKNCGCTYLKTLADGRVQCVSCGAVNAAPADYRSSAKQSEPFYVLTTERAMSRDECAHIQEMWKRAFVDEVAPPLIILSTGCRLQRSDGLPVLDDETRRILYGGPACGAPCSCCESGFHRTSTEAVEMAKKMGTLDDRGVGPWPKRRVVATYTDGAGVEHKQDFSSMPVHVLPNGDMIAFDKSARFKADDIYALAQELGFSSAEEATAARQACADYCQACGEYHGKHRISCPVNERKGC